MQRFLFVMSILMVGACYSEEPTVGVEYGGGVGYGAPSMAYVSPGVQVIADYDYPVFYSDGFYWRYDGGLWYRSGFYNRGWGVSYNVPVGVRGIARPDAYVHYNAGYRGGYNGYNRGYNPGYRTNTNWGGGVRDHRAAPAPVYRGGNGYRAPARGPVVRDHRR
jgi:hypothetical protein